MTTLPTASRLERAVQCAASNVLPVVEHDGGGAQAQGRAVHAFLENVSRVGREKALAALPEEFVGICEAIDVAALPVDADAYAAEVTLAYCWKTNTARELGRGLGRDYRAATATEFVGTADVVALLDDAVYIGDFKPRWSPNVTPAAKNYQLKFLALAACRAYGRSEAHVELIHVGPDGAWRDSARLDAFDLDVFSGELAGLADYVERAKSEPELATATEGKWCRFCPSFSFCPAKKNLALTLATAPETAIRLSPETAGAAWARLKAARQVLDRVEEALEAYARETPFATPDGLVVSAGERRTETIDGVAAAPVLERLGLGTLIEPKVTKTAITKAAGKVKAPEVLEALRKAGALKVTITNPIQEKRVA